MKCEITCFDRVMNLVKELPEDKYKEAVEIIQEYSFQDFLDFCIENKCFTEMQSFILFDVLFFAQSLSNNAY